MALTKSIAEIISEDTSGLLDIHPTWTRVRLAEVASILNGFPFESALFSTDNGVPLIRIRDVSQGQTRTFYRGAFEEKFLVQRGELLIGMDGDFNVARWRSEPALLNQRVCKITPDERWYHPSLLEFALPGYLSAINSATSSITVKHLSSRSIEDIELPLPPRDEQTRIVEKLEELLSDLDAGVAELKAAQRKLAQYRQSLLKAAVEGALTADWRATRAKTGEPQETGAALLQRILTERRTRWEASQLARFAEQGKIPLKGWQAKYPEPVEPSQGDHHKLPPDWTWATVDQISIAQKYGSSAKTSEDATGVPVLRMGNIKDGRLDLGKLKYLPQTHHEFPDLFLEEGDLLFNRTNSPELVGKTAIYRSEIRPCSYASYLIGVKLAPSCSPEFLSAFINSVYGRAWIKEVVTQQVGQANVNGSKLAALAVPLPPRDEQREIMARLETQLHASFDEEELLERAMKQAAAQRKNILKAAFAGQLVPQDPNDEPASVLLERIRAAKVEHAGNAKPVAKRGRKA